MAQTFQAQVIADYEADRAEIMAEHEQSYQEALAADEADLAELEWLDRPALCDDCQLLALKQDAIIARARAGEGW
jgi:hypothetical protein